MYECLKISVCFAASIQSISVQKDRVVIQCSYLEGTGDYSVFSTYEYYMLLVLVRDSFVVLACFHPFFSKCPNNYLLIHSVQCYVLNLFGPMSD
jgi:hypothetical protein